MLINIPDSNIDKVINRLKLKVNMYYELKKTLNDENKLEPYSDTWFVVAEHKSQMATEIFNMYYMLKYLGIPFEENILDNFK